MLRWLSIIAVLVACAAPVVAETDDIMPPHRITVVMTPGITAWYQLPSEDLINARRKLGRREFVPTSLLRRLADLGDGFAALRFAQRLEEISDAPNPVDVAHYYGIAAATGRGGAVQRMINALDQIEAGDLPPQRLNILKSIVVAYANAGNSAAAEAMVRYHWQQTPFGPMHDEVETVLAKLDGPVAAQLSLDQAIAILRDRHHTRQDLLNAEIYLQTAAASESLQMQVTARNLRPVLSAALSQYSLAENEDQQ